ncbi:MAG: ribosome maturation factor RimM [Rickettsiales bacterium]|jgi:16S rRNA processing protein RimM|nr:ribosome maturation factor RimM [Rickettsiales bacterium]
MLLVGKILSSHGLKGNVRLLSFFEKPEDIFNHKIVDENGKAMKFNRVGATTKKDVFLAKFEHINSLEEAKKYANFELFVEINELPAILDNEVYLEELVGMAVVCEKNRGVVVSMENYGAGNIMAIRWDDGRLESILYSDSFIKGIDKNNRVIIIDPPHYI